MNQEADSLLQREVEYTRGFLDALDLVRSDANPIILKVPEQKRFDALMAEIDWIHCVALEKHNENTRVIMMHFWNVEQWLKTSESTGEGSAAEPKCPSCGANLVKQKFLNVFDEGKKPQLQDAEENLYCSKCGTRWIPEPQASPAAAAEA